MDVIGSGDKGVGTGIGITLGHATTNIPTESTRDSYQWPQRCRQRCCHQGNLSAFNYYAKFDTQLDLKYLPPGDLFYQSLVELNELPDEGGSY